MYPNISSSSLIPDYSLAAYNACSSSLTLTTMPLLALIFVPIVLVYQVCAYNLFKGKVTKEDLSYEEAY